MKRIVLFVLTNLAVMVVLTIVLKVLGLDQAISQEGINFGPLLAFSAVVGFGGAIISLLISKPMAKWSTGAQIIDGTRRHDQALARRNGAPALASGPASACPKSRSTRASRTRSQPARSRTRRWSPSRPGCCSR